MLQIKGRFSVPWSSPDAFGLPYPEAFLFGEDGTIGSKSFGCVGTDVRGCTVPSSAYSGERRKSIDVRQITWVVQDQRRSLLLSLPGGEAAVRLVRELEDQQECDLFDVLAGLGYGLPPKWRHERAAAFTYKNKISSSLRKI
ncbi:MAG: hypothetical protein R6X27_02420 [Candidatus Desulfacyla sp.]